MLPGVEQEAGMSEQREQRFVEAVLLQAAVEAFVETILHRLARRHVMPFDAPLLRPAQFRHARRTCQ